MYVYDIQEGYFLLEKLGFNFGFKVLWLNLINLYCLCLLKDFYVALGKLMGVDLCLDYVYILWGELVRLLKKEFPIGTIN